MPSFADRLPPNELALVRCELERVGLRPNRSRQADQELIQLRQSSEPYIVALSARLMMPCPGWRATSGNPDNWQLPCVIMARIPMSDVCVSMSTE